MLQLLFRCFHVQSFVYRHIVSIITHNLLFTFKTVINERCSLYLFTITKLSRRTLCVPLRGSPLNEIHVRLITCSGRTEIEKNTRVINIFPIWREQWTRLFHQPTYQYLQQCSNNAEINSFWPRRFHFSIFSIFSNILEEKNVVRSIIEKQRKKLTWILPEWIEALNFIYCAAWKSGDVPTREGNFFLFPRNALKTIHLVVHHPVNPLHAVGAWLSIFQGPRGVSRWLGWKNEWTMGRVDRPRHRSEIEIDRPGRSSRSLAGLVRRQTAGLTVEPGLIEFRVRAERRFVIPASNLATSRATTLFRPPPRPSSSSGRLSRRVRAAGRLEILSAEWCCVDTYLEQKRNGIDQFCGIAWFYQRW